MALHVALFWGTKLALQTQRVALLGAIGTTPHPWREANRSTTPEVIWCCLGNASAKGNRTARSSQRAGAFLTWQFAHRARSALRFSLCSHPTRWMAEVEYQALYSVKERSRLF